VPRSDGRKSRLTPKFRSFLRALRAATKDDFSTPRFIGEKCVVRDLAPATRVIPRFLCDRVIKGNLACNVDFGGPCYSIN